MKFPFIMNEDVLTVYVNGDPYQVNKTHSHVPAVVAAVNNPDTTASELLERLDQATNLSRQLAGRAEVVNGSLQWNGHVIHSTLGQRVLDILGAGLTVDPWLRFVENVYANPNQTSRTELYEFLEQHNLPITEDGHFLAYKKVSDSYRDVHSGNFDNSVGAVNEMPRERVDHNRNNTCSVGFHFCSREYLRSFPGSHIMILKINPADVVSIPSDYNNAKGRCWRYEVVGEIDAGEVDTFDWDPVLYDYEDDDGWNDYEDDLDIDEEPDWDDWYDRWETNDDEDLVAAPVPPPPTPAPEPDKARSRSIWKKLRGK